MNRMNKNNPIALSLTTEASFKCAHIITIFIAYIEKRNVNVSALKIHVSPVTQSILTEFKTFQLEERGIIDVKVTGKADNCSLITIRENVVYGIGTIAQCIQQYSFC